MVKTEIINKNNNIFPIITVAGTVFAYFSIILISLGDFTRYIKNDRNLKNGNLTLLINLIMCSFDLSLQVASTNLSSVR